MVSVRGGVRRSGGAKGRGCEQHDPLPADCWEQMAQVDVKEVLLLRVPTLKSGPHFLRSRLRESFATALRERDRGTLIGDNLVQVRAGKLFALISTMLFQRSRGIGSLGRAELAQRVERFGCRCYIMRAILAGTQRAATVEEEQEKRGRAAQAKIQMGPRPKDGRPIICCRTKDAEHLHQMFEGVSVWDGPRSWRVQQ